ncbi:MAG: DtxR family iron (metal) dependent repressor [Candidatus Anoxymicrobium japonicum]|uniref:DtxR family iron (Metal) dependent repressor n=1 Tax=Candidatus Anoxymicrobium japonicum TaxID=2013648 RepID=A0A2N3G603_9ACTN|nr:MAG: DtxR family iron (metal) dependent repressor [Candidatus Anoxymicrobium japonicum]
MPEAFERYLETIYEITGSGAEVRVKDIATSLNVSKPSVSEMVDRLVNNSLVTHDKYQHIKLTAKGKLIAKGLDRKHEVVKRFFIDVLGVDEAIADMDACEIEHVISDRTLNKLVEYLEAN